MKNELVYYYRLICAKHGTHLVVANNEIKGCPECDWKFSKDDGMGSGVVERNVWTVGSVKPDVKIVVLSQDVYDYEYLMSKGFLKKKKVKNYMNAKRLMKLEGCVRKPACCCCGAKRWRSGTFITKESCKNTLGQSCRHVHHFLCMSCVSDGVIPS